MARHHLVCGLISRPWKFLTNSATDYAYKLKREKAMRQFFAETACSAASKASWKNGFRHKPPYSDSSPRTRFGRFSLMLGMYAAIGTVGIPFAADAAPRHSTHAGHGAATVVASAGHGGKSGRSSRAPVPHTASADARRSKNAHSASVSRPAHPGRFAGLSRAAKSGGAVRSAGAVHRNVVPLVNTAWDDPTVPPAILNAIQTAAHESGVDPHLLAAIAWRESRFDPDARNSQSSARGLLQFTSGTWLRAVRDYGSEHDVADYAAAIRTSRTGDLVVPEQVKSAILQLRSNPTLSAKLAADSMKRERVSMEARLGRRVTSADLYLMHVLGPAGAMRFLEALAKQPNESSLKVASFKVMRNAGLLAQDGHPLTVANTYAAAETMLDSQHLRSAPLLAAARDANASAPAALPAEAQ